jgi:hypothetical protein
MRKRRRFISTKALAILIFTMSSFADNPIVQSVFTADPAPMVYKDTLFLHTSHDADVIEGGFFTMKDWCLFSTTDMVNWQSRGRVASLKNFKWSGTNGAWAPQCVFRNGKFYLYVPLHMKGIGVLVGNTPAGPFTDPLGKALIGEAGGEIDPTAFVDSDGQAYLYWGNPKCKYVKLKEDMISYSGSINTLTLTPESFGKRSNSEAQYPSTYQEGPWFYKRDSTYYLAFAGGPLSEHLGHSTSTGPTGPWKYGGVIMSTFSGCAFTNHPGIAEFKGNSYLFCHSQQLSNDGYRRSVCVEKFSYNPDGTIPKITPSKEGAPQIGSLNPYDTVQAETICFEQGVETNPCTEGGIMVDSINNNDYIKVKGVDFRDGAKTFIARVASGGNGGKIELRLGSQTGTLVGTCEITGTGGWDTWTTKSCDITGATGKKDLFLKFTGGSGFLFNFNWWKFTPTNIGIGSGSGKANLHSDNFRFLVNKKIVRLIQECATKNLTVELFSLSGRLVSTLFQGTSGQSDLVMDMTSLRSGSYFIKVVTDKSVITKTITLQ